MADHERTERPTTGPAIPNLGRDQRIEGLGATDYKDQPETVSAPMPQTDPAAFDPSFEGDAGHRSPDPAAAKPANAAPARPSVPAHRVPLVGNEREPFVRDPVPHRTQPAVDLLEEEEAESAVDFSHESDFTTRRGSVLSGGGYRRSRADEKRFKKDLRYGQYLSVPKGRRDLFASKRQMQQRRLALVAIAVVVVVVLVLVFRMIFG